MIGLAKLRPGPGQVKLVERPEPEPAAGQVVVAVHGAGVCGTDLHIESGEYAATTPVVLGHEVAGRVELLGEGVDGAWRGARVVTETFFSTCQSCPSCRDGRPNLCASRRSIGTHVDGGFAPRLVLPAINLHRIPEWLETPAATLLEPLACVCQCLLDPTEVVPGDRVLVVGPGPMGLLAAQVARALGGDVVVAGLPSDAERLAAARALGFEAVDGGGELPAVDVSVDASGSGGGVSRCLQVTRPGGRFVQIGIVGEPVPLPLDLLLFKELDHRTGFASTPRAWRRALNLVERRAVELSPLVSEVAPLTSWSRVFADLRGGRGLKVVFDPAR
jgi:L-iditol 2-dehydrogenase